MRDFRELNQQINEVKRMLNSFIQKLTAQVEKFYRRINHNLSLISGGCCVRNFDNL
jgi:hypothetical protein